VKPGAALPSAGAEDRESSRGTSTTITATTRSKRMIRSITRPSRPRDTVPRGKSAVQAVATFYTWNQWA